MILDTTAEMIARDGISHLSMERIARQEGVSKALVYNYFDSLEELLKELLERELKRLRRLQFEAAKQAITFEDLVRNITREYLTYIDRRGLIIERLQSEPNLSDLNDPTGYGRDASVDYLAPILSRNFDMPDKLARAATDISFGLSAAAGNYLLRSKMSLAEIEDVTVTMILGSFAAVRSEYQTSKKKLKR